MNKPIIEIKNIKKTFKSKENQSLDILTNINLTVNKGDSVAILGQSGSGKSTLLSILTGLSHPSNGEVIINNQHITQLNEAELSLFRAQHIGIVFQAFHLMPHLNAWENVALPLDITKQKNTKEKALAMLSLVQLEHRFNHKPKQLSGGECQRVAIARALVAKPSILFADEPTGNLDQRTSEEIANLLFNLIKQQNMTMILATHNLDLAQRCQSQLTLKNGVLL